VSTKPQAKVAKSTDELVEQMTRFTKALHRVKLALTKELPDRAAYSLLHPLTEHDKRAAELADITHIDPSTVSRHIAQLVDQQLVCRVPDQQDGRSALVSLTDKGRDLCETMRERRVEIIEDILKSWAADETADLTRLLTKLNDDMEARHSELVDAMRDAFQANEPKATEPTSQSTTEDQK